LTEYIALNGNFQSVELQSLLTTPEESNFVMEVLLDNIIRKIRLIS